MAEDLETAAPAGPPPAIRPDARLVAVGTTGTGKSSLLRWLFATQYGRASGHRWRVLVDAQDVYELTPERGTCEARSVAEIDWRAEVIRFTPARQDYHEYEALYRELNTRPRVCAWLDEASLASPPHKPVPELRAYQTTGRKYGRAHLIATQFPVDVDRSLLSESHHRFCFQLERPEDVGRMAAYMGMREAELDRRLRRLPRPEPDDGGPSHGFVWYPGGGRPAITRAPLTPAMLAAADAVVRALR